MKEMAKLFVVTIVEEDDLLDLVNMWKVVGKNRFRVNGATVSALYRGVLPVKN